MKSLHWSLLVPSKYFHVHILCFLEKRFFQQESSSVCLCMCDDLSRRWITCPSQIRRILAHQWCRYIPSLVIVSKYMYWGFPLNKLCYREELRGCLLGGMVKVALVLLFEVINYWRKWSPGRGRRAWSPVKAVHLVESACHFRQLPLYWLLSLVWWGGLVWVYIRAWHCIFWPCPGHTPKTQCVFISVGSAPE